MARKKRWVRCPVCNKVGWVKRNRIVMTFCYPEKTIPVPNISKFGTTADAWDYAAKVCLRMSQRALRDPPLNAKSDTEIADAFYEHFRTLIPHSDADIKNFESIHSQRIKERLANKYNTVNNQEGRIPRMALSLLYGAIVCTFMSDLLSDVPAFFKDVKLMRKSAYAIYTFYSQLLVDERAKTTWLGWFKIIANYKRFGPSAAAKLHANEVRGGSLSRKQVKNKKSEVIKKWLDALTSEPRVLAMIRDTGLLATIDTNASAGILSRFQKFQFEVYHQERTYKYACVIHSKTSSHGSNDNEYYKEGKKASMYYKGSKSRRCEISPSQPLTYIHAEDDKEDNDA